MKTKKTLSKLLTWLPSAILLVFFIPNAFDKILHSNQMGKIVENPVVMIATGLFLVIAIALFLYDKTILIGTTLLALYMIFIVCIHMYKGKQYEVAMLIVVAIVVASYVRKPQVFHPIN